MDDLPPKFMKRVDTIISINLKDENFGVEALSKELSISYSSMNRKIKTKTGKPPFFYIREKRLERANYLLTATDLNIGEIALRVGFNTANYFSKCFHEYYKCTPMSYRKNNSE